MRRNERENIKFLCSPYSSLRNLTQFLSLKDNRTWWGMDFVGWRNPAVSNSLVWGYNFFVYGHRCGACHHAFDTQVRNKRMQYAKIKKCKWLFLTGYLSSLVCFLVTSPRGCTGEALYIVLGASRCDWHLFLWVTLSAL